MNLIQLKKQENKNKQNNLSFRNIAANIQNQNTPQQINKISKYKT